MDTKRRHNGSSYLKPGFTEIAPAAVPLRGCAFLPQQRIGVTGDTDYYHGNSDSKLRWAENRPVGALRRQPGSRFCRDLFPVAVTARIRVPATAFLWFASANRTHPCWGTASALSVDGGGGFEVQDRLFDEVLVLLQVGDDSLEVHLVGVTHIAWATGDWLPKACPARLQAFLV